MSALFHLTIGNPVLRRELLSGLRSSRLRWILLLYLAIPFLMLAGNWPDSGYYGGGNIAKELWWVCIGTQFVLVLLLTPIFASYMVSSEFEQRTAEFLWTTRVPPWLIILSKLLAVTLLCVALQIVSLPALSLIFFLGGVGATELIDNYWFLIATTLCVGSTAIFFSSILRRGHAALVCTYCAIVGFAVIISIAGSIGGSMGGLGCMLFLALALGGMACLAGSKPVGEKAKPNFKPIDDPAILMKRQRAWPYYLIDPMRRNPPMPSEAKAIRVVAELERQIHPLQRSAWSFRCTYVMATLSVIPVAMSFARAWGPENTHEFVWWLNLFFAGLWVILLHATSMTMDHEMDTLEGLRLTEIRPRDYLLGKWLGSLRMRRAMLIFGMLAISLANLSEKPYAFAFLLAPLGWWLCVETLGWITFAISSFCTSTMMATAFSGASTIGLFVLWGTLLKPGLHWRIRNIEWILFGWSESSEPIEALHSRSLAFLAVTLILCLIVQLAFAGVRRKWRMEK